ncbi:MAG: terminase large subunit domain-containing protein [Methylobacter sp.]
MPTLTRPQAAFIRLPNKFRAYVGGFGSGKTWVGSTAICQHMWQFPKVNQGYFAPSFPQIRDIFYPTIEEVAQSMSLRIKINQGNKEVHFYEGRKSRGTVICRSMDAPETIVGFKIGNALIDELDVMKREKAQLAWRKIVARMRYNIAGLRNGIDVATTPEGFRFVYEQFYKLPQEKPELQKLYGLIQSSTHENARFLPDDYIPSLLATYPPQLIDAYLDGQFVNLTSGSVYPDFSRVHNHSDAELQPGEPVHIGVDFNVYNCTASVFVTRDDRPIQVGELTGVRDTPALAKLLVDNYKSRGHHVTTYPDASGANHKSNDADKSDLQIIANAGLSIVVNPSNPSVKDRVNAVNAQILSASGERRFLINTRLCPVSTECLEQQVYDKNGEPDKGSGKDHANDTIGYRIVKGWPIVKPVIAHSTQIIHMNR